MPPGTFQDADEVTNLRYKARAGLLTELSRQTYDSFWKAVREAVLNSLDAGASAVQVDLSKAASAGEVSISDDGVGMSSREFQDLFMSLGGSGKYGDSGLFGRIGIGSLALLQYGESATVETKSAGSGNLVRAEIDHAWDLDSRTRVSSLDDIPAGRIREIPYVGSRDDHFTRVSVHRVDESVVSLGLNASSFFELVERLRLALPLPWEPDDLLRELCERDRDLERFLLGHIGDWSSRVVIHSPWQRDIRLTRRVFGDDPSGTEMWSGPLLPINKTLTVRDGLTSRTVNVWGYLLNQQTAFPKWSGLTARVQNVAVEENTFFDISADPGFRKYISGEIWIGGDVDRERLINIDRSSFNRESSDYIAVKRFMERVITDFKSTAVQSPKREKATLRRLIEGYKGVLDSVSAVLALLEEDWAIDSLPSSEPGRAVRGRSTGLAEELGRLGVKTTAHESCGRAGYLIETLDGSIGFRVALSEGLREPLIRVGDKNYKLLYREGSASMPTVAIKNRPRSIVINTGGTSAGLSSTQVASQVALEVAFLVCESRGGDPQDLYEIMHTALGAL